MVDEFREKGIPTLVPTRTRVSALERDGACRLWKDGVMGEVGHEIRNFPLYQLHYQGLTIQFHHSWKSFVSIESESDGTEQLIGRVGGVSSRVARSLVRVGMSQHSLPTGPRLFTASRHVRNTLDTRPGEPETHSARNVYRTINTFLGFFWIDSPTRTLGCVAQRSCSRIST